MYVILVYQNKKGFSLVTKIGKQPTVIFNELSMNDVIKFISSYDEIIKVSANVSKHVFDELEKRIGKPNILLEFRVS